MATATPQQIKSILKKYPSYPPTTSPSQPSSTPPPPPPPESKTFEERNREIALYHAQLIQQRKDTELEILLSTETLIDYPLSRPPIYTASSPSPTDTRTFKKLLAPFTTSDYDALIEERNINEHCGYTLCPNERVRERGGGTYRLLGMSGKAKDFRVVRKEELEKWCSEGCARRALYVRVQLSETPAWERGVSASVGRSRIDLLDEPKSEEDTVMEGIERLDLDGDRDRNGEGSQKKGREESDLALERGDRGMGSKGGLVDVKVLERDVTRKAEPPTLGEEDLSGRLEHLALEGYTSKFEDQRKTLLERERETDDDEMDEDEEDTDWKL
ncbi:hypothetical protein ONS95_014462 [Cadophora gregata]|uniref:uncharacterized protein n=1 Tax=Cadophora gregata TaxID=51156 RepID=UPI0026DB973B|nr:uncharacterized protein ONS95_014462 [Cadophora gregata]KAK0112726.1 hypothetical protein ONS95_014462 [Cadophora gregata]KAK0124860.1 hypothetical protein ONS96_008739 [Cadophora gregata f. sp. sojae]